MAQISVYIITYNQIDKIAAAINSVLWADEIVLVDSHSTDGTPELAEKLGARIVQVPFRGFGDLRNQAVKACQYEWIFSLDSDERCTSEARDEILAIINNAVESQDYYYVPRRNYFMGRWIKHCGWYPNYRQPQLFRRGAIEYVADQVHENYHCHSQKLAGYLKAHIYQVPFKNFSEMIAKTNRYSTLGVAQLKKKYPKPSMWRALTHSIWIFFRVYVLQCGMLDGWAGFLIARGHSYGAFYRYAKLYECQMNWPELPERKLCRKDWP